MEKEDLKNLKAPLSQEDFKKLKRAFHLDEIERSDLTREVLMSLDEIWAQENDAKYWDLRDRGIFGAYD